MNRIRPKQMGLTLIEMLVVLSIMTALFAFGIPAVKALQNAFASSGSVETMVKSALSAARAMALRDQRYVGVRFQEDLEGHQYMIFVEHDFDETTLAPGVRAIEGLRSIRLPDRFCVLDLNVRTNHDETNAGPINSDQRRLTSDDLADAGDNLVDLGLGTDRENRGLVRNRNWIDISSFSVIFSGTLGTTEIRKTRTRNRQGDYRPETVADASDEVFNSLKNINDKDHPVGQFAQDDYAQYGLGTELSRDRFVICDREQLAGLTSAQGRFAYLSRLPEVFVNRYSGITVVRGSLSP